MTTRRKRTSTAACGTTGGYQRHRREDGPGPITCRPCLDANARYHRDYRQKNGARTRPPVQDCGTEAAYQRHHRNGEDPCGPCRNAQREARRRRYPPKAAARRRTRPATAEHR